MLHTHTHTHTCCSTLLELCRVGERVYSNEVEVACWLRGVTAQTCSRLIWRAGVSHRGRLATFHSLPFTPRNNFDTLCLPDPTSCLGFMSGWLSHPLSLSLYVSLFSSILTTAGVLHRNVFTFVSWPAKLSNQADLFFLNLFNRFSCLDKRTQEFSCRLVFFSFSDHIVLSYFFLICLPFSLYDSSHLSFSLIALILTFTPAALCWMPLHLTLPCLTDRSFLFIVGLKKNKLLLNASPWEFQQLSCYGQPSLFQLLCLPQGGCSG